MSQKLIFLLVLTLALVLRFYKLGSYPVSLSWDEVAIGYNAYSIAKTGADEYGAKWPILFKSFNDYKLPGYIYLDTFFIRFFGLSEFSVRAPSAFFGVLTIPFMYLLTKELLKTFDSKLKFRKRSFAAQNWKLEIPIIAAAMMAISPWHLQLSRAAFESNTSLTIVLGGLLLLFLGMRNKLAATLSIPTLALSIYFYYSPRVFVPLILVIFFFFFKKVIDRHLKFYLLGVLLALLLLAPITSQLISFEGLKRVREVSIFEDKSLVVEYVEARAKTDNLLSAIFLNRRIPIVFETLSNYFSHFSFDFLFFGSDPNPRHRTSFHGSLYLFEIPLLIMGFWYLARKVPKSTKYFLIVWLLIAPIPAAFSQQSPHSLRALLMLPPLIILSSLGLGIALSQKIPRLLLFVVISIFFLNYLYSYYLVYPIKNSSSWAYGYKQMFSQVAEIENNYDTVIITGHYWKPYIYYLFYSQKSSAYNKVDPQSYLANWNQELIGKYRFGIAGWDSGGKDLDETSIDSLKSGKTLLVISPGEFQDIDTKERFKKLSTVSDYSGKQDVFLIGEWR